MADSSRLKNVLPEPVNEVAASEIVSENMEMKETSEEPVSGSASESSPVLSCTSQENPPVESVSTETEDPLPDTSNLHPNEHESSNETSLPSEICNNVINSSASATTVESTIPINSGENSVQERLKNFKHPTCKKIFSTAGKTVPYSAHIRERTLTGARKKKSPPKRSLAIQNVNQQEIKKLKSSSIHSSLLTEGQSSTSGNISSDNVKCDEVDDIVESCDEEDDIVESYDEVYNIVESCDEVYTVIESCDEDSIGESCDEDNIFEVDIVECSDEDIVESCDEDNGVKIDNIFGNSDEEYIVEVDNSVESCDEEDNIVISETKEMQSPD